MFWFGDTPVELANSLGGPFDNKFSTFTPVAAAWRAGDRLETTATCTRDAEIRTETIITSSPTGAPTQLTMPVPPERVVASLDRGRFHLSWPGYAGFVSSYEVTLDCACDTPWRDEISLGWLADSGEITLLSPVDLEALGIEVPTPPRFGLAAVFDEVDRRTTARFEGAL